MIKVCEICGRTEDEIHVYNSSKYNALLCEKCYAKVRYKHRMKKQNKIIKCDICNKKGEKDKDIFHSKKFKKNLCVKHYTLLTRYGKNKRTYNDPNEIIKYNDFAEVVLYDIFGKETSRTKIDLEDINKIKKYKWHEHSSGYVIGSNEGNTVRMHRIITECPENKIVDHINHDKLDNRKENLRICNYSQNNMNRKICSNNSSGYKGVYWCNTKNKWVASIGINYKDINLGYFENKEDAIKSRLEAEKKYFGEYRYDYINERGN